MIKSQFPALKMSKYQFTFQVYSYHDIPLLYQQQHFQLSVLIFITGDAGDSLIYHNGMMFSTKDNDNDRSNKFGHGNCAVTYKTAWWYQDCFNSHLNGRYLRGANTTSSEGVSWYYWRGYRYSLKKTEMKIRPSSFQNTQQPTLTSVDYFLVL